MDTMLPVAGLPAMPDALDLLTSLLALLAMLVAPLLAAALTLAFYWRWWRLHPLQSLFGRSASASGGVKSLGDVVMMPLETDLTEAPTFVTLPAASPSVFPTYTPPTQPAAPSMPPVPSTPTLPPVGSSLAVLDFPPCDDDGDDATVDDPDWPPAPRRPGAKTYRYVLASGELVRLRSLHRIELYPLPSWAYN